MKKIIGLLLAWSCCAYASSSVENSYEKLPINDAETEIIYHIIDTLGTNGLAKLYFKEDDMVELGTKVQHIHPLKFLGTIFTNTHLNQCMVSIEDSYFKWRGFMKGSGKSPGFIAKCEREYARNNFAPYIDGFCQDVEAHPDQIRSLIEKREWEKLVRSLIKSDE